MNQAQSAQGNPNDKVFNLLAKEFNLLTGECNQKISTDNNL